MVFYFTPANAEESKHSLYVGRDKVENEDLSECPARARVTLWLFARSVPAHTSHSPPPRPGIICVGAYSILYAPRPRPPLAGRRRRLPTPRPARPEPTCSRIL
jgi:hypothetical protein